MLRNRIYALLTVVALGLTASTSMGQTEDLARLLAPCIAEDTVAVVSIDAGRIDVDAIAKMVIDTASSTMDASQARQLKDIVQRLGQTWKQRLTQFSAAGGEHLYVVCNLGDLLLAVPAARLNESAMKSWMDNLGVGPLAYASKDGLLIAAPAWAMECRKAQPALRRAELSQAAAKGVKAPVEMYLIPSTDSRRVLEAMLPTTLGPGFELRSGALVQGLQWAMIGLDPPPAGTLQMHIESADAASAAAIRDVVAAALTQLSEIPTLKQAYPKLDTAVAMLTPQVVGNTARVSLDKTQFQRLAADFLTPGLFAMHQSILRLQCGTTLSGMGKAMLIYANDYDDKWPPNLETLVERAEYPRSGLLCPAMRHRPDYESYVYRGADTGGAWVEPMIIMVYDRAGNHEGGRNVLFVDSHVEWVTEERFAELVKQDNELRRKRGFAEKPAQ
jgi:prepilin-type processing-associated H-X9-DG protein